MYNQVLLMGRITKDLEIRVGKSDNVVLNFSIAINKKYLEKESVTFVNCVAFQKIAGVIAQYCKKGSLVFIDGEIGSRSYNDKNGELRYVTEVIVRTIQFLDKDSFVKEVKDNPEQPKTKKLETTFDRPKVVDDPDLPF
jgi:single-strand DNA-binding protein